jgi:hypothetical protein
MEAFVIVLLDVSRSIDVEERETGEYPENWPNGSYLFGEFFAVRQIVAVLMGGSGVTFTKAFKLNRLQVFARDTVGGQLATTVPESPAVSMGRCNTSSKSTRRSLRS